MSACAAGCVDVVRVLLEDSRVEPNFAEQVQVCCRASHRELCCAPVNRAVLCYAVLAALFSTFLGSSYDFDKISRKSKFVIFSLQNSLFFFSSSHLEKSFFH
jgi:hypothetical protein